MRWRPSPDVVVRTLGEEAVLVHLRTNRIFTLNPTGVRVWELLGGGLDRPAICERLQQEFDVDGARLDKDLDALLEGLRREGLVSPDAE